MASHLPHELLLEIVGYLEDDKEVLRSLSLACSSLRAPCQTILFSDIVLYIQPNAERTFIHHSSSARLMQTYRQNPTLLTHAKSVAVYDRCGSWSREDMARPPIPFPSELLEVIQTLALQNLTKVSIDQSGNVWNSQNLEGFLALVQCTTLASLNVKGPIPIQILNHVRSGRLEELSMQIIFDLAASSERHKYERELQRLQTPSGACHAFEFLLRSLRLDRDPAHFAFIRNLDLKALKNLDLREGWDPLGDPDHAHPILATCAPSLESLQFSSRSSRANPAYFMSPETIGNLKRLEELVIDYGGSYYTQIGARVNSHPWFLEFLGHLPVPCNIKSLRLQNRFDNRMETRGEAKFWNQIDTMLASSQRFPLLATASFVIDFRLTEELRELSDAEMFDELRLLVTETRHMFFLKLLAAGQLLEEETTQ